MYILSNTKKLLFPRLVYALGAARKTAFSVKGAGGGSDVDLDDFDDIYHQMFIVEFSDEMVPEIVGGYRFFPQEIGAVRSLDMDRLFNLDEFYRKPENMPAIELGRSFIIPRVQKQADVFFALFSGLGMILNLCHEARYFFGKITFYPSNHYNGAVLSFLQNFHNDTLGEIVPRKSVHMQSSVKFGHDDYASALKKVRQHMPEILRIYLRFTEPRFAVVSGAAENEDFGEGIIEVAFRIYIPAIGDMWRKRFLYSSRNIGERRAEILGPGGK